MANAYHVNAKRNTRVLASGQHWSTVTDLSIPTMLTLCKGLIFCKVGIESDFELNLIWRAPDSYRRWNSCADWWNVFLCKFQSQMACLVLFTNFRFGCYVKSFCSLFLCLGKGSWRFTWKYIARVPSSSDQTDGMRWKNQSIFLFKHPGGCIFACKFISCLWSGRQMECAVQILNLLGTS